ncbi:RNA polymerase sigma factor [Candidatus Beckwithbacteria bacterium]|nr:RNA polymerase sigma factor [Candidatus Beckwithbacteria bacterium]
MEFNEQQLTNVILEKPRSVLQFYRKLKPYLATYFDHKISNSRDREEIIQDTILAVFDSLPTYKGQSSFKTWVRAIAHHELVDYYRRKKIKTLLFSKFPFLEQIVDKALGPQLALEEKEAKLKIFATFKKLSEGNAKILRLRYMEGLSVHAIAAQLQISYKAAESRLSRARLAFAKAYLYQSSYFDQDS